MSDSANSGDAFDAALRAERQQLLDCEKLRRDGDTRRARTLPVQSAWVELYRTYRGDYDLPEVTPDEYFSRVLEAILGFGQALKTANLESRLDELPGGSPGRELALGILRRAVNGERCELETLVRDRAIWPSKFVLCDEEFLRDLLAEPSDNEHCDDTEPNSGEQSDSESEVHPAAVSVTDDNALGSVREVGSSQESGQAPAGFAPPTDLALTDREALPSPSPLGTSQVVTSSTFHVNLEEFPFKHILIDKLDLSVKKTADRELMPSVVVELKYLWEAVSDKPFTREDIVTFLAGNFGLNLWKIDDTPIWQIKRLLEKARGRHNLARDEQEPVNLDLIGAELGDLIETITSTDNDDTKRNYRSVKEHISRLDLLLPMRVDRAKCDKPYRELLRELDEELLRFCRSYIVESIEPTIELPIIPPIVEQFNTLAAKFGVKVRTQDETSTLLQAGESNAGTESSGADLIVIANPIRGIHGPNPDKPLPTTKADIFYECSALIDAFDAIQDVAYSDLPNASFSDGALTAFLGYCPRLQKVYVDAPELAHAVEGCLDRHAIISQIAKADKAFIVAEWRRRFTSRFDTLHGRAFYRNWLNREHDLNSLTDKARLALQAFYKLNAFDRESRKSHDEVAYEGSREFRGAYEDAFRELKALKFYDSQPGRGGGSWITNEGRAAAEKLSRQFRG